MSEFLFGSLAAADVDVGHDRAAVRVVDPVILEMNQRRTDGELQVYSHSRSTASRASTARRPGDHLDRVADAGRRGALAHIEVADADPGVLSGFRRCPRRTFAMPC